MNATFSKSTNLALDHIKIIGDLKEFYQQHDGLMESFEKLLMKLCVNYFYFSFTNVSSNQDKRETISILKEHLIGMNYESYRDDADFIDSYRLLKFFSTKASSKMVHAKYYLLCVARLFTLSRHRKIKSLRNFYKVVRHWG